MIRRYWHTIRHLRPIQLYGRIWFRLYRPKPDLNPAPPVRLAAGKWIAPIERPASMTGRFCFRLLNVERELQTPKDWDDPSIPALWRYHLHYFDDLNAEGAEQRIGWHREVLQRWMVENPPGEGLGWDPYPTSLRIVNWVKWSLRRGDSAKADTTTPIIADNLNASLAVQARWLRQRLEHHLLGNHLLANAKALVFAGCFFEGAEADRWRGRGEHLLRRELDEQILPDGGHFERSPMYHAIVLEDFLDLINLADAYPEIIDVDLVKGIRARLPAMLEFLAGACHPDGEIAFFNDAAMGMAPTPAKIFDYARRLGTEWAESSDAIQHWPDSGLVRLAINDAVLLVDVAPVGPDYLPGHAHADTLSFELSLFGQRVLVNSGTSVYGKGLQRHAERSTAAHNTVEIDGESSSEVWGGFRVARRANVHGLRMGETPEGVYFVEAEHDGYKRLAGQPIHYRRIELSNEALKVFDLVKGKYHQAQAYFYCHPKIDVNAESQTQGTLRMKQGSPACWTVSGGVVEVSESQWHAEFGQSEPSHALNVQSIERDGSSFLLRWTKE